jgi:hypothetical protein
MKCSLTVVLCGLMLLGSARGQNAPVPSKSALESDPAGWVNLLADKTLKDWVRAALPGNPFARNGNISDPSPWTLNASGDVLTCEGNKSGRELYYYAPDLKNFIIHAEYRYPPVENETRYNSGLFFRTSADGNIWMQGQATLAGGFLIGSTLAKGQPQRLNRQKEMAENRVKPAGEWNIYEIRAEGSQITLWVNGAVVDRWNDCEVPSGHVGLEAEGFKVEFRNVMLKRLP